MEGSLEVAYRGVEKTERLEALIREKLGKLERTCGHIVSCRVALERHHRSSGNPFRVRVEIAAPPGHRLVGTAGEKKDVGDLETAVRAAFEAVRRQVGELVERQRGEVKEHPEQENQAIVARLLRDKGYGFLRAVDGRELYFHRNSVVNDEFGRLAEGVRVRFVEDTGEKGDRAATVQVIEDRSPV
jgi:cold shock CspA family protein